MRTVVVTAAPWVVLSAALVAGCGSSGSTSPAASSSSAAAVTSGVGGAATGCPTSNTRSFAKTRFAGDVGLAVGSFHRYLWKPYQQGSFKKGANERLKALLKGGATAALDVKLLHNAELNMRANPTLCQKLYAPMSQVVLKLGVIKNDVVHGNFSQLTDANTVLDGVLSTGNSNGAHITESSSGTN